MSTWPPVNPDRYSLSKVILRKRGVVVHTSESGDNTMAALISLMARPGDRPYTKPDGSTGFYGSSYHAVANGDTGSYEQLQGASHGPFAAPPCNKDMWHICIPGWSRQTREEWLDPMSRSQIKGVAHFIVDKSKIDGFPLVKMTPEQVAAGGQGYCSHADITYGYHISGGHTDPGPNFPWDLLAADIQEIIKPREEEDMARIARIVDAAGNWVAPEQFVVTGGQMEWLTSIERRNAIIAAGNATLNPGTGAPYKLGRDQLKNYRLIGSLPANSIIKPSEFFQG